MSFSNSYIFGFATVVCVACSLAVSAAAIGFKEQQDINKERDRKSSILTALSLIPDGQKVPGEQIDKLWDDHVQIKFISPDGAEIDPKDAAKDLDKDGDVDLDDEALARVAVKGSDTPPAILAVYQRVDNGSVEKYAMPVYGLGLWGPVSGFLALDKTGSTVDGATFFGPKETPGLGAEIESGWFKDSWKGKKIVDAAGNPKPIVVAKGKADVVCPGATEHCVDGISGATLTCRGVNKMVANGVQFYNPFLSKLRQGG